MRIRLVTTLAVALVWSGCSSSRPSGDAPVAGSQKESATSVPGEPLPDDAAATALTIAGKLWNRFQEAEAEGPEKIRKLLPARKPFVAPATTVLESRGWDFFFTIPTGTSPALDALTEAIGSLPDHGIVPKDYPDEALGQAVQTFLASADRASEARDTLERAEGWTVLRPLVMAKEEPTEEQVRGLDAAGRFKGISIRAWDELLEAGARAAGETRDLAQVRAEIEVLATEAFFRYAMDMRFRLIAQPYKADQSFQRAIGARRNDLVNTFDAFARDPLGGLQDLAPKHPNYAATMRGLAAYRQMAEAGGFRTVKIGGKVRKGSRGGTVRALKERLAQEGCYDGPIDDVFDTPLDASVRLYQSTHGYDVDGMVEPRHARSLNVPVETRIRQIELSLQRWRESEVRHDEPLYVRVNIPEFMMEVWHNGALALKHRVVVGNNNWDVDPDARLEGRLNRTKIFTADMEKINLNPRWYVPRRIQKLELDFELMDDPAYYRNRNFVVTTNADGRELVYQSSGDDNALGRVKFIFPNPYGIFMHDTNLKQYFKREIRAFSHGCIRLQDPFEVAYYIAEHNRGLSKEQVQALKASEEPRDVNLDPKVPMFIEYNSVGVDEDGRMMFFSDVYGYDRDYFDGKIPYSAEELKLLMRKIRKVD